MAIDDAVARPWVVHKTDTLLQRRFFTVHSSEVTHPGGGRIAYDWIEAPDMVRVAALTDDGQILLVEQTHFVPGCKFWQAPGGGIGTDEMPEQAARRELLEETGYIAKQWTFIGSAWPLPGLTNVRVHLFVAAGLTGDGRQDLEDSEADLVVRRVPLREALAATAFDGAVRCASSAQLILSVAQQGSGWPSTLG